MNEPTTSTELLNKDIEHMYTSSIDRMMTTGVVPDKMSDTSIIIVIVDFKLTVYLSASSLAMSFALPTAIFVL
jgi:hypothetical protein